MGAINHNVAMLLTFIIACKLRNCFPAPYTVEVQNWFCIFLGFDSMWEYLNLGQSRLYQHMLLFIVQLIFADRMAAADLSCLTIEHQTL